MTKVAAVQLQSGADREANIETAAGLARKAAEGGAAYIQLPEYLNYLGPAEGNDANAETVPGPSTEALAEVASTYGVYVHAGSLLTVSDIPGKAANTSVLIGPDGAIIARYKKVHLFDIDVPGQVVEQESASIEAGDRLVTAPIGEWTLGLTVCFDLRFPELYRALAVGGATVLAVPAAFAVPTGRAHWEVLLRARAVENHAYVVAAGQVGRTAEDISSYGHSMIIDPWGTVVAQAETESEEIVFADIDPEEVSRRRAQIAVLDLRRPDVYAGTNG